MSRRLDASPVAKQIFRLYPCNKKGGHLAMAAGFLPREIDV
jgi:hypothetical protein